MTISSNTTLDTVVTWTYLLYATSDSHKPVATFARTHWAFLDQLAVNQQMFLYFFVLNKTNAFSNPAAKITGLFGIRLSHLPGVLIFGKSLGKESGVFFPIHVDLFKDVKRAEARLTQLFDTIGAVRANSSDTESVVPQLANALFRWKANEQMRPFWDYAAGQSRRLVNLPSDLIKKMAEGFARGLISNVSR
jgi:hypothetical protein